MYKLKLDLPNLARGTEVAIDGLGIFKNGSETVIDKDQAEAFRQHHQQVKTRYDKKGNMHVTTEEGPTLLQFFSNQEGVEVSTYEPPKNNQRNEGGSK